MLIYTDMVQKVKSMKIDDITQASLLYDFYGQLLSKRQSQVMELYHEENLSLSEIASEFNISRQGVHDALKNAEKALSEYERKLGLVEKFRKSRALCIAQRPAACRKSLFSPLNKFSELHKSSEN